MKPSRLKLSYYSYDSLQNPWCAGGGALRDFEVLRRLAKDWDVTLFVGRYPGFTPKVIEGIRMQALGLGNSNWLCRLSFALSANLRLLFDRADVIGNSVSPFAPIITGLLCRSKCFAVVHHRVGRDALKKFGLFGNIPLLLETLMLRGLRNFLVSNRSVADWIQRKNAAANVFVTSNSIDSALLTAMPKSVDPTFILFLGRFDIYMKGLDFLIDAYTGIVIQTSTSLKNTPPLLVIAGAASPQALTAVRNLIPERLREKIQLKPNVSDKEKRELLSSCLFFCSPSRFEGFGIAALEANASGKAVLVTDAEGFRDSVSAGVTAVMVPVSDVKALRSAMEGLIINAEQREALGKAGREWAKGFNWDRIAEGERKWIEMMARP